VPSAALVGAALFAIPNNDAPYDMWLLVGMALRSLGEPWARGLWDSWSQQSNKFCEAKQAKSWASFTPDGTVQIDNVFALARQYGWRYLVLHHSEFDGRSLHRVQSGQPMHRRMTSDAPEKVPCDAQR
jgi:hypothetical protein